LQIIVSNLIYYLWIYIFAKTQTQCGFNVIFQVIMIFGVNEMINVVHCFYPDVIQLKLDHEVVPYVYKILLFHLGYTDD